MIRRSVTGRGTGIRPGGGVRRPAAGAVAGGAPPADAADAGDDETSRGPGAASPWTAPPPDDPAGVRPLERTSCPRRIRLRGGVVAPGLDREPASIRPKRASARD